MSDTPATLTVSQPAGGTTVTTTAPGADTGRIQVISISDSTTKATSVSDSTTAQGQPAGGTSAGGLAGREAFLYAGVGLVILTVVILSPLARRRPDWKVRLGLPYLVAFVLVSYAIDGSWPKTLAMAGACLLIVFGLTMLRLWRWRIARKPALQGVSVPSLEADAYVRQVLPALRELGFTSEAGYEVMKPYGSLAVLTLRHRKDPVVAQVRLAHQGTRRYPHLVFATRLRGGEQVWTWNIPGALPPQPPQWTSYHHAGIDRPDELYQLHLQHLAARPAVTVADKDADVAKRIASQTEWELQTQEQAGWLAADGDRLKLTGKAIRRWTAAAFFAFLGVPMERMKLPTR